MKLWPNFLPLIEILLEKKTLEFTLYQELEDILAGLTAITLKEIKQCLKQTKLDKKSLKKNVLGLG